MKENQGHDLPQEIQRRCPLCGHGNEAHSPSPYSRGHWIIKHCGRCEFVYLENVVPYTELIDNFAWTKTYSQERQMRKDREPVLMAISDACKWVKLNVLRRDQGARLIQRYVPSGRLLDIGCGHGAILRDLPETLIPFGIEIEARAAKKADEYAGPLGGRVWHDDAISGLNTIDPDYFDAVLMKCYLEHEISPREVLQGVQRVLRPGGLGIIKVPNYSCWNRRIRRQKWCGFRFPDHVNYFTPKTLSRMVTDTGLQIDRFGWTDRIPSSDNMWMIVKKPADAAVRKPACAA